MLDSCSILQVDLREVQFQVDRRSIGVRLALGATCLGENPVHYNLTAVLTWAWGRREQNRWRSLAQAGQSTPHQTLWATSRFLCGAHTPIACCGATSGLPLSMCTRPHAFLNMPSRVCSSIDAQFVDGRNVVKFCPDTWRSGAAGGGDPSLPSTEPQNASNCPAV